MRKILLALLAVVGVAAVPGVAQAAGDVHFVLGSFGMNDGAVWVGRGLTAAVKLGASARWGPVELTLAPTASIRPATS